MSRRDWHRACTYHPCTVHTTCTCSERALLCWSLWALFCPGRIWARTLIRTWSADCSKLGIFLGMGAISGGLICGILRCFKNSFRRSQMRLAVCTDTQKLIQQQGFFQADFPTGQEWGEVSRGVRGPPPENFWVIPHLDSHRTHLRKYLSCFSFHQVYVHYVVFSTVTAVQTVVLIAHLAGSELGSNSQQCFDQVTHARRNRVYVPCNFAPMARDLFVESVCRLTASVQAMYVRSRR